MSAYVIGVDPDSHRARAQARTKCLKGRAMTIGVDEVGRGPLAGPVCVCAVALPPHFRFRRDAPAVLRDSKRLTAAARERWHDYIRRDERIAYAVAFVSPRVIDHMHIHRAANLAATRAVRRLLERRIDAPDALILTDGALHLNGCMPFTEIIRGDETVRAIQLASIVAKVARDRRMVRLHRTYGAYGFDRNKGYGTAEHWRCIAAHGTCELHRLTFCTSLRENERKRSKRG